MTRRAPLPKITECVELQQQQGGARRSSMLLAVYPFMLVALLCLAHIHTRFVAADMTLQISQMQKMKRLLQLQENMLERDHESMSADMVKAESRAVSEGKLTRPEAGKAIMMANVSAELMEKYTAPLVPRETSGRIAIARAAAREEGVTGRMISLLETGQAFASAVQH